VEASKVDRVVADLVADHDRLDGQLPSQFVERLLEKRGLRVDESADVRRQLGALGIDVGGDIDSTEPDDAVVDPADVIGGGRAVSHAPVSVRLQNLGSKLLTAEEEVELGRRMELGRRALREIEDGVSRTCDHDEIIDLAQKAKEKMVMSNIRLVLHIAKPYVDLSDLALDDLFQEGIVGLMRAVDGFDHTLGYKFSTYATWWIRQAITRALADRGTTVRLPVHVRDDVLRLRRAQRLRMQMQPGRRITPVALADELAWTVEKVHFMQQIAAFIPASLDERVSGYDDLTLAETLVSDLPSPEEHLDQVELAKCLDAAMAGLKPRECEVLHLRFGLDDSGSGATLEDIGSRFGVTRERVRQVEAKALGRLRHPSRADVLREFLGS